MGIENNVSLVSGKKITADNSPDLEQTLDDANVSADYFISGKYDEYVNDFIPRCIDPSFKKANQSVEDIKSPEPVPPIVATLEFQEATLAFGNAIKSEDYQTAITALHDMVIKGYRGDPTINQLVTSPSLERPPNTSKGSRISCTSPDLRSEKDLENDIKHYAKAVRVKQEYIDTQFVLFIYAQMGIDKITPAMHVTIANAFEELNEKRAAFDQYELASQGATTKSSEVLYHVLALQTLPPDEQVKHSVELTQLLREEMPALRRLDIKWKNGMEKLGPVLEAIEDTVKKIEESSSEDEITYLADQLFMAHPEAFKVIRAMSEPSAIQTQMSMLTNNEDPTMSNLDSSSSIENNDGAMDIFNQTILPIISKGSPLEHVQEDNVPQSAMADVLGLNLNDPDWKLAGISTKNGPPKEIGSVDEITLAWFDAWNMLYTNSLNNSHVDKIKLEELLYEDLTERLAETGGKIPESELRQFASSTDTILRVSMGLGGELENARLKQGKEIAATKHEFYSSIVEKLRAPLIKSGNRERLASLDFSVKFDGLMAQHRYNEAMQSALPGLLKEYAGTETAQIVLTQLQEIFPHLFKQDCLVLNTDFSDSDIGSTMAEREESLLRESTEIGFVNSMLVGTGYAAGGCITGGATGATLGAFFFGVGAVPGAILGCKIGSVTSGLLGTSAYVVYEQSVIVKANADMVESAKRSGVSRVSEHDANVYKWLAHGQVALYGGLSGLPAAGLGKGAVRLVLGGVDRLIARGGTTWLTVVLAEEAGKKVVKDGLLMAAEKKAAKYQQQVFKSKFRGWYNTSKYWNSMWEHTIKRTFWRSLKDLEAKELTRIGWIQNNVGQPAAQLASLVYRFREPLTWVPGTAYSIHDLIKNNGDLSLLGAIGLAMPINQVGRIAFKLNTSGSAVTLGFAIGLEYAQQIQAGYDLKAPDGWKVLKELVWIMPQRSFNNIIIKGRAKYVDSLLEPPLQKLKELAVKDKGRMSKIFRSVENDRNKNLLWRWAKSKGSAEPFKLHTPLGRAIEFGWITPVIAVAMVGQAKSQDADFSNLFIQTLARYGYGAAYIVPRIKAPRGMDTGPAEFWGRAADSLVRLGLFNEGYNKYTPSVKGYKVGSSNYRTAGQYNEKYLEGKIKRSFNTLEPFSGAVRVATKASSAFDYETWYQPDPKALNGYRTHIGEVLLGGPKTNRNYNNKYRDVYSIYAEAGDPTMSEFAENWLYFLDYQLTQYATHEDNPVLMESFVAKSAEILLSFTDINPTNEEQAHLQELAKTIRERHEMKIKNILGRFKMDHADLDV